MVRTWASNWWGYWRDVEWRSPQMPRMPQTTAGRVKLALLLTVLILGLWAVRSIQQANEMDLGNNCTLMDTYTVANAGYDPDVICRLPSDQLYRWVAEHRG